MRHPGLFVLEFPRVKLLGELPAYGSCRECAGVYVHVVALRVLANVLDQARVDTADAVVQPVVHRVKADDDRSGDIRRAYMDVCVGDFVKVGDFDVKADHTLPLVERDHGSPRSVGIAWTGDLCRAGQGSGQRSPARFAGHNGLGGDQATKSQDQQQGDNGSAREQAKSFCTHGSLLWIAVQGDAWYTAGEHTAGIAQHSTQVAERQSFDVF